MGGPPGLNLFHIMARGSLNMKGDWNLKLPANTDSSTASEEPCNQPLHFVLQALA